MTGGNNKLKIDKFEEAIKEVLVEQPIQTMGQKAASSTGSPLRSFAKGAGEILQMAGITKEAPFQLTGVLGASQQKYSREKKYYPNIQAAGGVLQKKADQAMQLFETACNELVSMTPPNTILDDVDSPDEMLSEIEKDMKLIQADITALEQVQEASLPFQRVQVQPRKVSANVLTGQTTGPQTGLTYKDLQQRLAQYKQAANDVYTKYSKPPLPGDDAGNFTAEGKIYKNRWPNFVNQVKLVIMEASRRGYSPGAGLYEIFQRTVYSGYSKYPRRGRLFGSEEEERNKMEVQQILPENTLSKIHTTTMYPTFVNPQPWTGLKASVLLYIPDQQYSKLAKEGGMLKRGTQGVINAIHSIGNKIPTVRT